VLVFFFFFVRTYLLSGGTSFINQRYCRADIDGRNESMNGGGRNGDAGGEGGGTNKQRSDAMTALLEKIRILYIDANNLYGEH
jgi:hypothetical protein